jgi:hypothetical protein
VTVLTQPTSPSQTCSITNGSGTLAGADVSNVAVTCVTDTFTVGGNVSGLTGSGLVLQNNAGDELAIGADGSFTFATELVDGSGYAVTVLTQPTSLSQTCSITNGSGTLAAGSGLVLQNNAGDDLAIGADGSFTFATELVDGSGYAVTVLTQPTSLSQTCSITNGSGTLAGTDVSNVAVTCVTDTFTVGGSVSGLTGSGLVLQNNAGDDLAIGTDGSFIFSTPLDDGSGYAVTVLTQPTNLSQTCGITNDSGTLAGTDVSNVAVTCVTDTFSVGGNVSGLAGSGLVLQNNAGDDLAIGVNGSFIFSSPLDDGSGYAVTVLTQPTNLSQTCSITNGSGTLAGTDVTDVAVTCVTDTFSVGGNVSGLAGSGLVLQNNAGDDLAIGTDGSFTFATELVDGSGYAVAVLTQPSGPRQICSVSNSSGTIAGADVSTVAVTCVADSFSIGGNVSGLAGSGLVLQNNAGDDLAIGADGSFTFVTALVDGSGYAVTVLTQPTNLSQTCGVTNGSGVLAGANVNNISVTCVTDTFSIGGNVSGLAGFGLVLQNNAGDDLAISADGSFTFVTALVDGSGYAVTVLTQPTSLSQTCGITNGSGTLAGADVSNVTVTCVTDTFTIGGNISGLAGSGLVLQNNGGDDLAIGADGSFTFATELGDGSGYSVTVLIQPTSLSQTCSVVNGSGVLAGANVNDISVTCVTDTFSIGGNVSGLAGSRLVLQNNAGDDLAIGVDGSFTFAAALVDGSGYAVTVLTQPTSLSQTPTPLLSAATSAAWPVPGWCCRTTPATIWRSVPMAASPSPQNWSMAVAMR